MRLTSILRSSGSSHVKWKWGYAFRSEENYGTLDDRVRGSVIYKLSPFEQSAFAGVLDNIPNNLNRFVNFCIVVCPFFLGAYTIYSSVEHYYHHTVCRKNPDDYKEFYETIGEQVKHKDGRKIMKKKWPKL